MQEGTLNAFIMFIVHVVGAAKIFAHITQSAAITTSLLLLHKWSQCSLNYKCGTLQGNYCKVRSDVVKSCPMQYQYYTNTGN